MLVEAFILISELFTIPELLIGRETKTDSSKTPGLQPLQKERKDLKSDLIRELKGKTPMLSVKQLIDSPIAPTNSYTLTHQVG